MTFVFRLYPIIIMQKIIVILVSLLGIGGISFAQLGNNVGEMGSVTDIVDPNFQNSGLRYADRFSTVAGTPYLIDAWQQGEVVTGVGKKIEGLSLKFDAFSNIVVMQKEEEEVALMEGAISEFSLFDLKGNAKTFRKFPIGNMGKQVFAQILFYGKLTLLKHHKVNRVRTENNSGGYGDAGNMKETEKFSHTDVYYVRQKGADQFETFKPNRKSVLAIFPDHQEEVATFIKKEKLKLKSDEEISQLLQYYENL